MSFTVEYGSMVHVTYSPEMLTAHIGLLDGFRIEHYLGLSLGKLYQERCLAHTSGYSSEVSQRLQTSCYIRCVFTLYRFSRVESAV